MKNTDQCMEEKTCLLPEVTAAVELAEPVIDITLEPIGARRQTQTAVTFENGVAVFVTWDQKNRIVYTVDTNHEKVQQGLLHILASFNGGAPVTAVADAGVAYLTRQEETLTPAEFAKAADVSLEASFDEAAQKLTLRYTDIYENVKNSRTYTFGLKGYTLMVCVDSPSVRGQGGYCSFRSGISEGMEKASIHNSIYVEEISVTDVDGKCFLSAYPDKAKSNGTRFQNQPSATATGSVHGLCALYELNSHGQTNPLRERFYVTVSDVFLDCVYLTNGQPSQYLDQLVDRVILDSWNWQDPYTVREANFGNIIQEVGMKDSILVEHRWQFGTLDMANPVHYPANTTLWGTEEEFQSYIKKMKDLGCLVFLHEDYWFVHPHEDNYYYNDLHTYFPEMNSIEDAIAQHADGSLRVGWQSDGKDPSYAIVLKGRPYVSYATRSDMLAKYADREGKKIQAAYKPDGSFLDVNGGVDPDYMNQLTYNADCAYGRTLSQVIADNVQMFQVIRNNYKGAVMSEGAQGVRSFGSAYAGWLESGSREITDCCNCMIMPDYELKYIRPLMINQGMGPLGRFLVGAEDRAAAVDKYWAAAIAYGHTGFVSYLLPENLHEKDKLVNDYYLFRALQPQYLAAGVEVESIEYVDASGKAMVLEEALRSGYDFRAARVRIAYSSGLELCLNFAKENWIVSLGGKTYTLDTNGWAAVNPREEFEEFSCLVEGCRVDYVNSRLYTYVNTRGRQVTVGGEQYSGQFVFADGKTVAAYPMELEKH